MVADDTPDSTAEIDFTLGSRRLLRVPQSLATWSFSLDNGLGGALPAPPPSGRNGVRVLSAPTTQLTAVTARYPGYRSGGRQDYRRHYIEMGTSFGDYLPQFPGKTRSTLRRKARRPAEEVPGG